MIDHFVPKRRVCAAFTLTEVVVSAGILGIALAGFFAAMASGFGIIDTFRQDLRATQILTQKTEFVRMCAWNQVQSLPAKFQDHYYTSNSTNGAIGVTYYGTIDVGAATCITNAVSYYDKIKLVTVGLVWTNHLGSHAIPHTRQMTTLVSYNGLFNYLTSTNITH